MVLRSHLLTTAWGLTASLSLTPLLSLDASFAASPLQLAQRSETPDDVVVDTEPQRSDPSVPTDPSEARPRFACEQTNGQYTVMYYPESQPGQSYLWATPSTMGGGWTAERRCFEISRRLEAYRPDGLLEMRTSIENGYNIICVTTQQVPACRIVLTVPEGQDPIATRDRVFQNLTIADAGQRTQAVNTFTGNDDNLLNQLGQALNLPLPNLGRNQAAAGAINLRPFLDQADGGTGRNLRRASQRPGMRLSPDRFR